MMVWAHRVLRDNSAVANSAVVLVPRLMPSAPRNTCDQRHASSPVIIIISSILALISVHLDALSPVIIIIIINILALVSSDLDCHQCLRAPVINLMHLLVSSPTFLHVVHWEGGMMMSCCNTAAACAQCLNLLKHGRHHQMFTFVECPLFRSDVSSA
eukprot:scaffold74948_cov17-Tisochrysis_lutea.AAC.2